MSVRSERVIITGRRRFGGAVIGTPPVANGQISRTSVVCR
jgi:hypothetical protein